jgi:catechol 2,3-dioxygenase-like lactoylglutathione lyase family enzyme
MFSKGLSEIVLIVEDVRKAARFYQEAVGLAPEMAADDHWAWFWAGAPGRAQRIALHKGSLLFEEHSPLPEGERWGQVHFALEVPREELEAAVAHLQEKGVEVYGPTHFEWMKAKSYYFYDPDGNLLEFWSPDPSEANEALA